MTKTSAFSLIAAVLMLSACTHEPSATDEAQTSDPPEADATAVASSTFESPALSDDEDIPDAIRVALAAAREQAQSGDDGARTFSFKLDDAGREAMRSLNESRAAEQRTRWIDMPFPVTELVDKEGNSIDLVGRRTVVNFWATWCAPCIKEIPLFQALDAEDNGVRVVTVSNDFSREPLDAFLAQTPLQLPVAYDTKRELADALGVRAWPASFVLDDGGRIENIFGMVADMDALRKAVGVD